jgi:AcrR family transcriptional regulator
MRAVPGLRERKKQQTRQLIADTARQLFTEHGFDSVTVAAVAAAANVSEGTVFNYFPTKEHLFFDGMENYEAELLTTIRDRGPGESVLAAFGRFVIERSPRLADTDARQVIATSAGVIGASPALQTREREIISSYTQSLAALIAEETDAAPDDIEPWVAANAIMGVHQALLDNVRRRALGDHHDPDLAAAARAQTQGALARLEHGLANYAVKSRGNTPAAQQPKKQWR